MNALLVTGFVLAGCGIGVDLIAPVRFLGSRLGSYLLSAAATACFLIVGAVALAGHLVHVDLRHVLQLSAGGLYVDRLSGLFLVICFGVGLPVAVAMADWARIPDRVTSRGCGTGFALTVAAIALVVSADNIFILLFGWELLSFAFYLLAGVRRQRPGNARASLAAFAFGKAGGAFLLVGFLLLAGHTGSWQLPDLGHAAGAPRDAGYVLLIIGFSTKCGLVPLQIWLPPAYEAAAGPARALMAGSAVNVGFYGLWRTLALLGKPPVWIGVVVLLVASVTAILGIAHATVQTRLTRVIAYSSIENSGLIVAGYGVGLAGAATGNPRLLAVGLVAGTLQTIAHAIAKSLLFTATGTIESAVGGDELDSLRGISRRLPFSGTGLGIGCLTLAGLPPTIGFVSEWFLLESMMQQFRLPGLALKLAMATAGALVALTTGFASVTFVRLLGFVVLGNDAPGTSRDRLAGEAAWAGRIAVAVMSLGCLAVAALSPLEARMISAGLSPIVNPTVSVGVRKGPWVLQPVFAGFSILSPSWLWVMMPALLSFTAVLAIVASRAGIFRVRRVPPWRSATAGVSGQSQYTAFGYANPTRKILADLLLTHSELREVERDTGGRVSTAADDDTAAGAQLGYTSDVVEVVEAFLYRPLLIALQSLVRLTKQLQSGRLDAYVAYMLIALVAVLAVVTALA